MEQLFIYGIIGSEKIEDKFKYYFHFRLFTTDSIGHCAIQLRFNNNEALPERELSEGAGR
jgi:hypothetical protein